MGSPERPLSDLGLITYQSYWKEALLRFLANYEEKNVSIKSISEDTAITPSDIVSTFQVPKGCHGHVFSSFVMNELVITHKRCIMTIGGMNVS